MSGWVDPATMDSQRPAGQWYKGRSNGRISCVKGLCRSIDKDVTDIKVIMTDVVISVANIDNTLDDGRSSILTQHNCGILHV